MTHLHALREARRVARPGGEIALTVFGRPERCESTPMFAALGQVLPSESGEVGGGPALHQEGMLESLATEAGLVPREAGYLVVVEGYPDLETLISAIKDPRPCPGALSRLGGPVACVRRRLAGVRG